MDPAAKSSPMRSASPTDSQFSMVVLVALFAVSGFQSSTSANAASGCSSEKSGTPTSPGFWPSWLSPSVNSSASGLRPQIRLDAEFWPYLTTEERKLTVDQLAGGGGQSLNPEQDGSLITADSNLVHLQVSFTYRRAQPARPTAPSTPPTKNESSAPPSCAASSAAASLSIDEVRRRTRPSRAGAFRSTGRSPSPSPSRPSPRWRAASRSSSSPSARACPRLVARDFRPAGLPAAGQEAGRRRRRRPPTDPHRRRRRGRQTILAQIDRYEQQLRLGKTEEAETTRESIDKLLLGEPVAIDGREINPTVDGRVPAMLSDARLYRATLASQAQGDLTRFLAVRDSYLSSPRVVVNREWTEAFRTFLRRDSVQVQLMPPALDRLVVMINPTRLSPRTGNASDSAGERGVRGSARLRRDRARFLQQVDPSRTTLRE